MATTYAASSIRLSRSNIYRFQGCLYILDWNASRFSDAVIRQFTGNVCAPSVQMFGSNVIEKVNHASNFQALTDCHVVCSCCRA